VTYMIRGSVFFIQIPAAVACYMEIFHVNLSNPCSGILKSTCNTVSILIIYILGHISVLCSFLILDLLRFCATWMMTDKYRGTLICTDHKCNEFGYFDLKDWIWPYLLIMTIDFFIQERYIYLLQNVFNV
jgi:hypothetical protein